MHDAPHDPGLFDAAEDLFLTRIVIGERVRADVGDVSALAESIERLGLLQPLVVNTRWELIAGRRRLAAVEKLGWKTVPCRVVESLDDATAALQAERDENTCREPLKPSELVAIGRKLEALEKVKAKARQGTRTDLAGHRGHLPPSSNGKTRDKVADALGDIGGKTFEKGKQVAEAAEREPEKFADLVPMMDTKSVHAAHRELKAHQKGKPQKATGAGGAEQKENTSLPASPFVELAAAVTGLARRFTLAMNGADDAALKLTMILTACGLVDHTPGKFEDGETTETRSAFLPLRGVRALIELAAKPGKVTEREVLAVWERANGTFVPPLTEKRRKLKQARGRR